MNGTCGDCIFWDQEHGVDVANPNRIGKSIRPLIRVAPCLCRGVTMSDIPNTVAFMDADASCEDYGSGFQPGEGGRAWTMPSRMRLTRSSTA